MLSPFPPLPTPCPASCHCMLPAASCGSTTISTSIQIRKWRMAEGINTFISHWKKEKEKKKRRGGGEIILFWHHWHWGFTKQLTATQVINQLPELVEGRETRQLPLVWKSSAILETLRWYSTSRVWGNEKHKTAHTGITENCLPTRHARGLIGHSQLQASGLELTFLVCWNPLMFSVQKLVCFYVLSDFTF